MILLGSFLIRNCCLEDPSSISFWELVNLSLYFRNPLITDLKRIETQSKIDNESQNAMIWFKRLERHPFVKNPNQMIQELNTITKDFFDNVKGLIWYSMGNPKPNFTDKSDWSKWVITHVTRGNYRFALKEKVNTSKYKYLAVQG